MNPLLLFNTHRRSANAGLAQSRLGGSGSGTTSATTNAVGFASPTTNGSLLICVVISDADTIAPTISTPITSGFSWTLLTSVPRNSGTGVIGRLAIYYIQSAGVMSVATQVTATAAGASITEVQFSLYEFTGILSSGALDTSASNTGAASTIPSTANLTTTVKDLIFVAEQSVGSPSAGASYTLGVAMNGISMTGVSQFILNQTSGSIATAFGSTTGAWGCIAAAFKV
jgi:hypothetical protein